MRLATRAVLLVLIMATAGCRFYGSVHALVDDGGGEFDPGLLGTWYDDQDSTSRATLTKAGPQAYRFAFSDFIGGAGVLRGQLVRLGAHFIMDVAADTTADEWREVGFALPLHQFLMLERRDSVLFVSAFDADSLWEFLQRQPAAVSHIFATKDLLVLTAPTSEVRVFLARFATRPHVLAERTTYRRLGAAGDLPPTYGGGRRSTRIFGTTKVPSPQPD